MIHRIRAHFEATFDADVHDRAACFEQIEKIKTLLKTATRGDVIATRTEVRPRTETNAGVKQGMSGLRGDGLQMSNSGRETVSLEASQGKRGRKSLKAVRKQVPGEGEPEWRRVER